MAARMASPRAFEQVIRLAVAQVKPPEIQHLHADIARRGLAEHLASRPDRPRVTTIVDGRIGASEDSVRPFGIIRYEFDHLKKAAVFAMAQLRELAPELTGRYRSRWFFMVNGAEVEEASIPSDARSITITNDEPYSRRLVAGKKADGRPYSLQNPPPGFIILARRAVMARYGNSVEVAMPFLFLRGGYRLKADYKEFLHRRTRPENRAGQPITYPSLILEAR